MAVNLKCRRRRIAKAVWVPGVIVSPDGYILTNNHVVDGATDVQVTLPTGASLKRRWSARIRNGYRGDQHRRPNLPAITVGDSSKMQVGDACWRSATPLASARR